MFKKLLMALLLLSFAGSVVAKSDPLVGRYQLINQMETVSVLVLKPDHSFKWGMIVGSADLKAHGTWSVDHDVLQLKTPEPPPLSGSPKFTPFSENDMKRVRQIPSNFWQVAVMVKKVGGVPDIAVVVETASHKRYKATTEHNGIARVFKPKGGQLARVGLRWVNDSAGYHWFDVPAIQAAKNTAAFWVQDPKWAAKQPFEKLTFTIEGDLLISNAEQMTYRKVQAQ
ncbi:hypothetical protein [Celerinatantimonas diazotrophica]|uniref:DUF3108 domain-containing protein n=1 Tax=Celerinatantimonas diazotrophica TaxID=412034 RepID=A0A4R1K3E8_9GAMM|nr:hypothetical protein [Celerinatantimonas diazotrophica]TCK58618.1 hypothetical protein EV690_0749 [Celerinatantimonas diazotrophica]CAG9297247.1 hypothetical protein CEDIAZO_02417 [Celerinatantimonas diazotrophica]